MFLKKRTGKKTERIEEAGQRQKQYQGLLAGLLGGMAVFLSVFLLGPEGEDPADGLKRPNVPWKTETYELEVRTEGLEERISLEVRGKSLSEVEMEKYFQEAEAIFWAQMLGENESFDSIQRGLNFSGTASGTDFTASFRPESYSVIGADGSLVTEGLTDKGTKTKIYMDIQGGEEERSYEKNVTVWKAELSEEEMLRQMLFQAEKDNRKKERVILPEQFEGKELIYEIRKDNTSFYGALFCMAAFPAILWYLPVHRGKEQLKKRQKQMLEDYPDLVLKFLLLLQSGLTIRNVWGKIASDYFQDKKRGEPVRYAYEQLCLSYSRISSGVPEREEYENFGARCVLHPYLRLSGLFVQNLEKGNKSLFALLQGEQRQAFEERKNQMRKAGEEASTRLLGPMMVYFFIVLLILLVPAFMSFSI